jgi:hypothetical protein
MRKALALFRRDGREELRQGKHFPVTRLTTIKSLCEEPEAAAAFALFLAHRIQS